MRIISACLSFILLVSILIFPTAAQSAIELEKLTGGQIDEALLQTVPIRFLPNHPLYFLITIKESVTRFLKPSSAARLEFDFILSGKRLKESYLLISNEALDEAQKNLIRYDKRLNKMVEQLEKARSQNQDIASQIGVISDGFKSHETLLIYFLQRKEEFAETIENSLTAFEDAVNSVDIINPGVKDRFRILILRKSERNNNIESSPGSDIDPLPVESTPSYSPRRIIL